MKKILVMGSINIDISITAERMPESGETVFGSGFETNIGGKGANQAVACGKLGGVVSMAACTGFDDNGKIAAEYLSSVNVNTDYVFQKNGETGSAVIVLSEGDNRIIVNKGTNGMFSIEDVDKYSQAIKNADIIVFQLEIPIETVTYAAKLAKTMGKTVILNPAPMANLPAELLINTDFIIPNETEAQILTGIDAEPEVMLNKIREMGVKNVIITLGDKGCIYNDGEIIKHHGIYKTNVVDTTAAGDTFIGALSVYLAQDKPLDEAVDFASLASAITVSRRGAGKSVPTLADIKRSNLR